MASLLEVQQQRQSALNRAESILTSAEMGRRKLSRHESSTVTASLNEHSALSAFTLPRTSPKRALSADYVRDFATFVTSGGSNISAIMSEGEDTLGGYAVPAVVAGNVVQLAPEDSAVRSLATIINTDKIVKFPVQTSTGVAAIKQESGATTNLFTNSTPTVGIFQLGAYTVGVAQAVSLELFDDVPSYMAFLNQDMGADVETCEEHLYLTGTGIKQPQGILGNVGAGVSAAPDTAGNLVTADATLDILGTLKARYHENASWIMQRVTGVQIRKALLQAGDSTAWTRSGAQDYLHGYPVAFSAVMPAASPGACPALFGDFEMGYMIGQRGGPAIRLLTMPQAIDPDTKTAYILSGRVLLICFRRVDGRVRRSEAIQQLTCAAS